MTTSEHTNGSNDDFVSTKEAAAMVSKGKDAMTNWVKKFAYDTNDPRREHLLPTIEEVDEFKKQGRTWAWKLSRSMVLREFGLLEDEQKQSKSGTGEQPPLEDGDYVRIRTVDLEFIKEQNSTLSKQNNQLVERLKEANILRSVDQLSRNDLTPEARKSLNLLISGDDSQASVQAESMPRQEQQEDVTPPVVNAEVVQNNPTQEWNNSNHPKPAGTTDQGTSWLERHIPSVFSRRR